MAMRPPQLPQRKTQAVPMLRFLCPRSFIKCQQLKIGPVIFLSYSNLVSLLPELELYLSLTFSR